MKTKIIFSIVLGIAVLLYVFTGASPETTGLESKSTALWSPAPGGGDEFLIGCLHDGAGSFQYTHDSLNFNLWHLYLGADTINGKYYPKGWTQNDSLFSTTYVGQVQGVLYDVDNHDMKALMQRPKIEYLCYGQRSDYQCEPVDPGNNYRFYSFNDHNTGVPDTDSGQGVVHCRAGGSGPNHDDSGFVVKRLKTNTEQCHSETGSDAYRWDSQSEWLIKPRIRIDSTLADNLQNYETPVCRVYVLNQNGNVFKDVVLKIRHFVDEFGNYDGRYLEEFNYESFDSVLTYYGAWGNKWWYNARGSYTLQQEQADTNINRADIQVYWYGNCDMWIDYVRVDNDIAHDLFSTDSLNTTHDLYMNWLQWEAQDIACYSSGNSSPYQFYIELFEFNQIPCMSYVSRKIDEITYSTCGRHFNVMADALCFYQCHMSWKKL